MPSIYSIEHWILFDAHNITCVLLWIPMKFDGKKEKYINQLQDFISRKKQKLKNQKRERLRIKGNKASENEKSKNWIWRHFSRQWSSNVKCLNSEEFANHMAKTKFDNGFEPDSMDFVFVLRAKYSMIIICLWAS